jgi:hypothetical protein
MLDEYNPLVRQFRLARDRLMSPMCPEVFIRLCGTVTDHGTHFTLPAAPELAPLLVGSFTTEVHTLDVVVETRSGDCKQIHPINPSLMTLQYPLLFSYGDVGYNIGMTLWIVDPHNPPPPLQRKTFRARVLRVPNALPGNKLSPVLCSGRLSQQYVVNAFSCVEGDRLCYFVHNQSSLRLETY